MLKTKWILILIVALGLVGCATSKLDQEKAKNSNTIRAKQGYWGTMQKGVLTWDSPDNPIGNAGLKFEASGTIQPPPETGVEGLRPYVKLKGREEILIFLDWMPDSLPWEGRVYLMKIKQKMQIASIQKEAISTKAKEDVTYFLIGKIKEIKGNKIYVSGRLWAEYVKDRGGIPVYAPRPEVYLLFERGIIDGAIIHSSSYKTLNLNKLVPVITKLSGSVQYTN
jgi:hypothetical protein